MADKNQKTTPSQESLMLLYRLAQQVWNEGREEVINDVIDPNATLRLPTGTISGQAGYKAHYDMFRSAFSHLSMTLQDTVTEGDRLAVRWEAHMQHTGNFLGIEATDRHLALSGITFGRAREGRIFESWEEWNLISLLAQLEILPDHLKGFAGIPTS
jgi:predicted ester cyclase